MFACSAISRTLHPLKPWVATVSSAPQGFVEIGGLLYFVASDPDTGTELHVTDGTAAGTRAVVDLFPGTKSGGADFLTELPGGAIVFVGDTPAHGRELRRRPLFTRRTTYWTPHRLDPVPLLVSSEEWSDIEAGLRERVGSFGGRVASTRRRRYC